jgi:signal transduction histidine kinase
MDINKDTPLPLRILVADDERVILDFHRQILCDEEGLKAPLGSSLDLVCCLQAEEAVDAVRVARKRERPFAVVFLDVCMPPGPDGVWAAEQIRRLDPDTQIVLMTGNADVDPLEVAKRAPPSEQLLYIRKPFHPQEIQQFASALSAKWDAERGLRQANAELESRVNERTQQLQEAYEDLKKLDTMKDAFLSSVSHELRTPLTSIRSFSEILLSYDEVAPEDRREFLEIINSESERLTRLINDLLDLSRIESGKMVWHDDLMSLAEVIRETARTQHCALGEKSLRLTLDLPEDLPFVFADRDRIHQVVANLLGNAIKFSFEGGEIRMGAEVFEGKRSREASEWIKVSVSDEGVGIEEKDREFIFDKFRQGLTDHLTEKPKGTGLGLPICKEIVAYYDGNLWVESREGGGSTFFFTLPAVPESMRPVEGIQPPEDLVADNGKKTILLVDDNYNMRKLLRYQFQHWGYRVLEAATGSEALEKVHRTPVDLITLDLMMPTMSGYDLLGALTEDLTTKDIPVLIISVVEDKEKGILFGASDYLNKPFRQEALIEKVQSLLGSEKRRILVVDDDPAVSESLRLQLEDMGFSVDVAQDGEEAIDQMKVRIPDLVILDIIMPRKNGHEVLRWIRNQPNTAELPVIILSANPLVGKHEELLHLGVDAHFEKSRGLSVLYEKVDAILRPPPGSLTGESPV